jgi:hypothetical protein
MSAIAQAHRPLTSMSTSQSEYGSADLPAVATADLNALAAIPHRIGPESFHRQTPGVR